MRVVRISILLLAIVACAWFVLAAREAHEVSVATSVVAQGESARPSALRHASSVLQSAGILNPDTEVNILRARVLLAEKQPRGAIQIMEGVVRREPQNLEAWVWLAGVGLSDEALTRTAIRHVDTLDPHH